MDRSCWPRSFGFRLGVPCHKPPTEKTCTANSVGCERRFDHTHKCALTNRRQRGMRFQFRFAVHAGWSRVAEIWTFHLQPYCLDHIMRRLSPFWLAFIVGCMAEGVLAGVNALYGSIGPCGPGNTFTILFGLWHLPGMILSSPLWMMDDPAHEPNVWCVSALSIEFIIGALTFTCLFYFPVRWLKESRH